MCFLTFTQALTVVNTQWHDPFTCVPIFWKSNSIYHRDPSHLQSSHGWAEVYRLVSSVKERKPQPHTGTHTHYTDSPHHAAICASPWGFNSYFMCYHGLKEEVVSQGCWWNSGLSIELPLCHWGLLLSGVLVILFSRIFIKSENTLNNTEWKPSPSTDFFQH